MIGQYATRLWTIRQTDLRGKREKKPAHILVDHECRWLTKITILIIGKAQKPHAFKGKTGTQLGFQYKSNTKAWMTCAIYQDWLLD